MTDALLLLHSRLTKRATQLTRKKVRIISEPVFPEWPIADVTGHLTAANDRPRCIDVRRGAHVRRSPIDSTVQHREEQSIVLVIERLTSQIAATTPAFAVNSRTTIERAHRKPGIVSNSRHPRPMVKVSRLGECILLEGREHLERVLLGRLGDPRFGQVDNLYAVRRKQRTEFAKLARAPRCQQQRQQSAGVRC